MKSAWVRISAAVFVGRWMSELESGAPREDQPAPPPTDVIPALANANPAGAPPRSPPNRNALSLASLFTLTTVAAIGVTIVVYFPYLLCLIIPFIPPAIVRTIYIKAIRETTSGKLATLTEMSLDFGSSMFVSAILIFFVLTAGVFVIYAGMSMEVPAFPSILAGICAMVFVGIFLGRAWWLVSEESIDLPWPLRIRNFLVRIIPLGWAIAVPVLTNSILSSQAIEKFRDTSEFFAIKILASIALAGLSVLFALQFPFLAGVILTGICMGNLAGHPITITMISVLIGLIIQFSNLRSLLSHNLRFLTRRG